MGFSVVVAVVCGAVFANKELLYGSECATDASEEEEEACVRSETETEEEEVPLGALAEADEAAEACVKCLFAVRVSFCGGYERTSAANTLRKPRHAQGRQSVSRKLRLSILAAVVKM